MAAAPGETTEQQPFTQQADYEKITSLVTAEFQVEERLLLQNIPTYYLKQPQQTKQAFLRLLKNLEPTRMIATLRRENERTVLRVIPKPPVKPSNPYINYGLLLATVATTFTTGYYSTPRMINPFFGGATFMVAILAVLGTHEMGHKLTANRKDVEATQPYFIPGPPPFGTFGAVIMQKSLPPNKDALFDIGADGPIIGFIAATVVSIIGLTLLIPIAKVPKSNYLPVPLLWTALVRLLQSFKLMPIAGPNQDYAIHPVAFAGWAGIIVTMLNLLPAGMLDGGHVTRSIAGKQLRLALTALSIVFLVLEGPGFYAMAVLVLLMATYRHPGALDDVSDLSNGRKMLTIGLVAIFILCVFPQVIIP